MRVRIDTLRRLWGLLSSNLDCFIRRWDTLAIHILLDRGAYPQHIAPDGLLMHLVAAAGNNQGAVVPLLVEGGASLELEVEGPTPPRVAVTFGSAEVVQAP